MGAGDIAGILEPQPPVERLRARVLTLTNVARQDFLHGLLLDLLDGLGLPARHALRILGEKLEVPVVVRPGEKDVLAIAHDAMAEAARRAEAAGAFLIDINMGCPVKKVVNGHAGSALMRDEDKAQREDDVGEHYGY